jgi:biotin carboxyl carrier protein
MKFKAQSSGTDHELSLDMVGTVARIEVDGRHYEIDVRELAYGKYLLKRGSQVYKCRVEGKHGQLFSGGSFAVVLRGQNYDVTVIDPKRLRSGQSSATHQTGAAEIASPMPGKIVRVLVERGAHVQAGAGVIVVEAMKMQNEMKSPKTGVVISINTEAGATVNAGDILAVIE